jgi:cytoskeletal protein CcmA (bactofilin family)
MIGQSIRIKGEIAASDPIYIYGSVEGTINASAHRVTVGKEGTVKADITAREVVIMGDVCGKLQSDERVEIRSEGSLLGNLSTQRLCVEEGAVLQGTIDVHMPVEKAKPAAAPKPAQAEAAAGEQEQNLALSEAS